MLDSITEAIKAKKTYGSHFPPRALNFQWNKILEKSIDLPFLLCCIGDEDQRRFVLFYAQPCNLNLYFHPDSHNFIECTALSAHTLPKYYHILVDSSSIWIHPAYFLFESLVSLYSLTFQYPKFSPIIRDKSFRTIKDS